MKVTIIDYGRSNLLSVQRALAACGAGSQLARRAKDVLAADMLVLPGVGAFADGMAALERMGLVDAIRQKVLAGTPMLGICLGMQLLFDASDEGGVHRGLGLVPGRVEKISPLDIIGARQPVPHIGWAPLLPAGGRQGFGGTPFAGLRPRQEAYFVHSFAARPADPADRLANTLYGGRELCAAVLRGNLLGCQFHPEKSAGVGLTIIKGFLTLGEHAATRACGAPHPQTPIPPPVAGTH